MNSGRLRMVLSLFGTIALGIGLFPFLADARTEKPTIVVEEFFRLINMKNFEDASELVTRADRRNVAALKIKAKKAAKAGKQVAEPPDMASILGDMFFLVQGQENKKMMKKSQDGETIMPEKIGFFVPGQFYIVGNFAVVFTREIYIIGRDNTGPVRDDPRKLWIDPTNELSKVRDEAYFKQWWVWEDNTLTMPGVIWLVKERREWRIDLLSGVVPRKSFKKILRWHFGRDVFEEEKKQPQAGRPPAPKPKAKEKSTVPESSQQTK
ncbi:hypothetical protein K8S19_11345 [bacterium]|nr:hypothetical protein [bacterium]